MKTKVYEFFVVENGFGYRVHQGMIAINGAQIIDRLSYAKSNFSVPPITEKELLKCLGSQPTKQVKHRKRSVTVWGLVIIPPPLGVPRNSVDVWKPDALTFIDKYNDK